MRDFLQAIGSFFTQDWRTGLIKLFYFILVIWGIILTVGFVMWLTGGG